jgi:hypothetical protein
MPVSLVGTVVEGYRCLEKMFMHRNELRYFDNSRPHEETPTYQPKVVSIKKTLPKCCSRSYFIVKTDKARWPEQPFLP